MGTTKRQPLRHSVRFWNKPSRSWVMVARFSWQKDADQFLENISRSEAERETRFAQFFGNRLVSYCTGGLLTWPTPAGPTPGQPYVAGSLPTEGGARRTSLGLIVEQGGA